MAKTSIIAAIKAKPNARGVRSHLPITCSTPKCENDFFVSSATTYPPVKKCPTCYGNPTTAQPGRASKSAPTPQEIRQLIEMGLIA